MKLTTWAYDGGADIHGAFALSGEPVATQVKMSYGTEPREQMVASKIAATNVAKRRFQKEYMEYWNSTKNQTGTGRPVDAIIAPLAPFPAARPDGYLYYGYSTFVNILDYSSCVIPITTADKEVDIINKDFKPLNHIDKRVSGLCKYCRIRCFALSLIYWPDDAAIYDGAHVSIQLIGRRLQEEKVLALAEYLGDAIIRS